VLKYIFGFLATLACLPATVVSGGLLGSLGWLFGWISPRKLRLFVPGCPIPELAWEILDKPGGTWLSRHFYYAAISWYLFSFYRDYVLNSARTVVHEGNHRLWSALFQLVGTPLYFYIGIKFDCWFLSSPLLMLWSAAYLVEYLRSKIFGEPLPKELEGVDKGYWRNIFEMLARGAEKNL